MIGNDSIDTRTVVTWYDGNLREMREGDKLGWFIFDPQEPANKILSEEVSVTWVPVRRCETACLPNAFRLE